MNGLLFVGENVPKNSASMRIAFGRSLPMEPNKQMILTRIGLICRLRICYVWLTKLMMVGISNNIFVRNSIAFLRRAEDDRSQQTDRYSSLRSYQQRKNVFF